MGHHYIDSPIMKYVGKIILINVPLKTENCIKLFFIIFSKQYIQGDEHINSRPHFSQYLLLIMNIIHYTEYVKISGDLFLNFGLNFT